MAGHDAARPNIHYTCTDAGAAAIARKRLCRAS